MLRNEHGTIDLFHEISLRSASNRMDARNLTIVICPNLIPSNNFPRDIIMCSVPNDPVPDPSSDVPSLANRGTTLGTVIKLCIERYFEVFDEVWDRSETVPPEDVHTME